MDLAQVRGRKIKAKREQLGISRAELAEAIGVTEAAIGQWESGRTKDLKLEHAIDLEVALNITLRWLVKDAGPNEAAPSMDAYHNALVRRDEAAKQEQRRAWERIAAVFAKAAVVLLATIPPYGHNAEARGGLNITATDYTMNNRRRRELSASAI